MATHNFNSLLNQLYALGWVVFCNESFKSPEAVIEYLGRYTHRVAISNSRIKSVVSGKVAFEWKDRKDGNKTKSMVLDAFEFIRRFLLHILPGRFMKIRTMGC
ncbi:MAG: transposase [Negativicutes bacterium]